MRLLHGCALQRLGHRYRALGAKEMISHMTSLFKQVVGTRPGRAHHQSAILRGAGRLHSRTVLWESILYQETVRVTSSFLAQSTTKGSFPSRIARFCKRIELVTRT